MIIAMKRHSRALLASLAVAATVPLAATVYADDKTDLSMDQVPKAARETIQHEAQGGKVEDVKKLTDDGHLFVAEIKKGDSEEKLYVDSTGKMLGRYNEKK